MDTLFVEHRGKSIPFTLNGKKQEITYLTRIDPLSGNVSKISEIRASRGIGISVNVDFKPSKKCDFCDFITQTPEQRVRHRGGAISVPNRYPWEKYDWITIYPPFTPHKTVLSEIDLNDLEMMVQSSYDLAEICSKDSDVLDFVDFTNWGAFAGASQQHPHSQRKSMTFALDPGQKREMDHCREIQERFKINPFDLLVKEELSTGSRIIFQGDILITSAFAPACAEEILVIPGEPVSHILQMNDKIRKSVISPVLGIFHALFFYRGINDFNIAVHMAPFNKIEEAKHYYRWHIHIYPRKPRLPADRAGAEIGYDVNVIDILPEHSASILKNWYKYGPEKERLVRQANGQIDPWLLQEFDRIYTMQV